MPPAQDKGFFGFYKSCFLKYGGIMLLSGASLLGASELLYQEPEYSADAKRFIEIEKRYGKTLPLEELAKLDRNELKERLAVSNEYKSLLEKNVDKEARHYTGFNLSLLFLGILGTGVGVIGLGCITAPPVVYGAYKGFMALGKKLNNLGS